MLAPRMSYLGSQSSRLNCTTGVAAIPAMVERLLREGDGLAVGLEFDGLCQEELDTLSPVESAIERGQDDVGVVESDAVIGQQVGDGLLVRLEGHGQTVDAERDRPLGGEVQPTQAADDQQGKQEREQARVNSQDEFPFDRACWSEGLFGQVKGRAPCRASRFTGR